MKIQDIKNGNLYHVKHYFQEPFRVTDTTSRKGWVKGFKTDLDGNAVSVEPDGQPRCYWISTRTILEPWEKHLPKVQEQFDKIKEREENIIRSKELWLLINREDCDNIATMFADCNLFDNDVEKYTNANSGYYVRNRLEQQIKSRIVYQDIQNGDTKNLDFNQDDDPNALYTEIYFSHPHLAILARKFRELSDANRDLTMQLIEAKWNR